MAKYRLEGPIGVDVTQSDTEPKFAIGERYVEKDVDNPEIGIWRYCKHHSGLTAGKTYWLNADYEVLEDAVAASVSSTALNPALCVPQTTVASGTAALYGWMQTGGLFDRSGVLLAASTSAGAELYLSSTAGQLAHDQAGKLVVGLINSSGSAVGTSAAGTNTECFSPAEIIVAHGRAGQY